MQTRLFLPSLCSARNRLLGRGAVTLKTIPLALLGLAICIALYVISWRAVSYFHAQSELGIILSMKIYQMAWITIFIMLVFSSMIAGVSTLYLSKDNEIMVAAPIGWAELFRMRLLTTFFNTSWMVLIFTLPVFAAFGTVFQAGPLYWPLLLVTIPTTALIASGSAMLLVILLVFLFPARRTKDIIFYLTLCFGILLYLVFRLMRPEDLVNPEKYSQFVEYLAAVSNPAGPWLPAGWTANLLTVYLLDRQIDWLLLGLLVCTPPVLVFLGEWLMEYLFIGGYSKSQESFGGYRRFRTPRQRSSRSWIFRKELISFLRDSREWSQFFMIAALVVVYLYNFKVLPLESTFGSTYVANLISFGNIGLTGFLAAALAARFVYPSIGAEGGAFYLILSSPLSIARFFWYKYFFYVFPFSLLTAVLIVVSNHLLQISGPMWWISLFSALLICWTVVAMALGFGAMYADYHAENRTASLGIGAVLYFFCAAAYLLVVLLTGFSPVYRLVRRWIFHHGLPLFDALLTGGWVIAAILISLVIGLIVSRRGIKALQPK